MLKKLRQTRLPQPLITNSIQTRSQILTQKFPGRYFSQGPSFNLSNESKYKLLKDVKNEASEREQYLLHYRYPKNGPIYLSLLREQNQNGKYDKVSMLDVHNPNSDWVCEPNTNYEVRENIEKEFVKAKQGADYMSSMPSKYFFIDKT